MIKRTTKADLVRELDAMRSMERGYRYVNQAFSKGVGQERTAIMGKKIWDIFTKDAAVRNKTRLALLFIDLDHFKTVNDTCGHAAGDLLIQAVARRLQSNVRKRFLRHRS